jgi:hypothetical protein
MYRANIYQNEEARQTQAVARGEHRMSLFPASTNAEYRGSPWSVGFLGLTALLTIGPGCIHYFLPDGGAGVIAGLDLARDGKTIVGTFAWMGALQIPYGMLMLIVALRYRTLVPLFLAGQLLQTALGAVAAWVFKGTLAGHHPPENYAVLVNLPLLALFLWLSLRMRKSAS